MCGVCECDNRLNPDEIVSGKYCECDNYSCDRAKGLLCGGAERGTCSCGYCTCEPGWTGPDCSCKKSIDSCMIPNSDEICSGRGECACGACKCHATEDGPYLGKYCEKCPTCGSRCFEFKECVQCQMYKTGEMGKNANLCAENCTKFIPLSAEKIIANEAIGDHLCTFYDEDDCRFQFSYNDRNPDDIKVVGQDNRDCPEKAFSNILNLLETITNIIST